jgi:vitamin B12 transporter
MVSAPGFETRAVDISAAADAEVALSVAGLTERIVVTATRHPATIEEAGVAASILARSDLAQRQFSMAADILRQIPGLQVTATGGQGSLTSVFIRGAQRTGTLFLLDGVPVNDPGGEFNLAHLTSGDLDRIEVIRGPESALFGAEAAAGVVQLFTRRGDPENTVPKGSLAYERASFGSDAWKAGLTGGSGYRLDYSLHGEQLRTAGEFPNDDYRNTTGSANVGLRIGPATELRGVLRVADSVVGVPGQVAYGLVDFDARETNRDSTLSLRLDDTRGSHYAQQFSFGYHRMRDLYTDSRMDGPYKLEALVRDVETPQPRTYLVSLLDPERLPSQAPPGTRLVTQEVTLYPLFEPFLSATSRQRLGYQGTWGRSGATAVFGYDYERQDGDVSGRNVTRDNHGLFLHGQQTLSGRVFLAGGVRLEHSSAYGQKLTPRGAAGFIVAREHGPLSSTFVRLSAGRGFTEPSLLQNFAREFYAVGNPDLRPERADSYEAGLVQEWFGRRARTEAAFFQNSFRDLITWVPLPAPVWGSWRNIESSRARGLEISGRARLGGPVTLTAAYMRLWTRIITSNSPASPFFGTGQELSKRPGNSGSVSLSVAPRRCWFQAGAVFVGERQDPDFYLGVTRNPGYQNVYAAASYRLSEHLAPFFRAENLLNSRYQEVLGYASLSRSLRGGVRLEW